MFIFDIRVSSAKSCSNPKVLSFHLKVPTEKDPVPIVDNFQFLSPRTLLLSPSLHLTPSTLAHTYSERHVGHSFWSGLQACLLHRLHIPTLYVRTLLTDRNKVHAFVEQQNLEVHSAIDNAFSLRSKI